MAEPEPPVSASLLTPIFSANEARTAVAIPDPVPLPLRQQIDQAVAEIPTGKTGTLSAAVSQAGMELGIGAGRDTKAGRFSVGGWAAREWGKSGWTWGAKGTWSF